ncbi:phage recombinase [Secundilactobacillus pentosiphilus]|uniref:Phage recombinase n=1 Tax=Secundilactobacillus pentosiphilus TaxID=1714682 RepID=A0A1Z5IQS3_9LACO|nr:recombinase RecT [Secundilactobacillus pentosiphilus]GAX04113.1 phage recombinase [Secundilactobacillus pentosiphilus]
MANLAKVPMKVLVKQDGIKKMFQETLQDKAPQFMTSLVSVVNENHQLQKVDQMSVINSAMVAATLDLPINQNLGYMWLVPYSGKATPQIGYKGYIQLAMRTGQYKSMNAIVAYEGEIASWNALTEEVDYDPAKRKSDKVIGYIGYFKLTNGFEKTVYWTRDQIDEHRQRFSKMSGGKQPSGVWKSDYDAMALKTVLRNMLSKWGPMSTEMATAVTQDEKAPAETVDIDAEETASETTEDVLKDFEKSQKETKQIAADEGGTTDDQTESDITESDNAAQASLDV